MFAFLNECVMYITYVMNGSICLLRYIHCHGCRISTYMYFKKFIACMHYTHVLGCALIGIPYRTRVVCMDTEKSVTDHRYQSHFSQVIFL